MEDRWIIELSDNETLIVTTSELLKLEKECIDFDGFYGFTVKKYIDNECNL